MPMGRAIVILWLAHSFFTVGSMSEQTGWFSKMCLMCDTILDASFVSADKIKIRAAGFSRNTHAAKIPTTDDFPECRNDKSKARPPSAAKVSTRNFNIFL